MEALLGPAFPNQDAFFCRFFTEVSSIRDAADRPLHEVDFRAEDKESAYQRCPFHDSRRGYLMNKAALSQITSEWDGILDGIEFYSALFRQGNQQQDLAWAWRICLASMFAPLYLLHRKHEPFHNGQLPTLVSGVFKIMLDVPTTIDLMFLEGIGRSSSITELSTMPELIQSYADSKGILINGEYVCAGSPGLISRVVRILFQKEETRGKGFAEFQGYFPDTQNFLEFNYLMTVQFVIGQLYLLTSMAAVDFAALSLTPCTSDPTGTKKPAASPREPESPSAYERRRQIARSIMISPLASEAALRHLTTLVEDPRKWNLGIPSWNLSQLLNSSIHCLQNMPQRPAKTILGDIRDFRTLMEEDLRSLQSSIEACIGAQKMFPERIRYGNLKEHPVDLMLTALSQ